MKEFCMKICDALKDIKKKTKNKMIYVWVHDSKFIIKYTVKASILYYKRLAKALKNADLSYSNRYNNHIQY